MPLSQPDFFSQTRIFVKNPCLREKIRLDKGIPLLSDFLGECGYSASSPGTYGIRKQFT